MDAHEKNAVLITAHASLKSGPRDLLHDMLFMHAGPGRAAFTIDAARMVRKGRSLRTVWRHLNALDDDDWIRVEPGPVRYVDGRPKRSPNTYRILTVAERYECQIGTILIPAGKIPPGTGASTEAAERFRVSLAEAAAAQEALTNKERTAACRNRNTVARRPRKPWPTPAGDATAAPLLCSGKMTTRALKSRHPPSRSTPIQPQSVRRLVDLELSWSPAQIQSSKPGSKVPSDKMCLRTEGETMRWNHPVCDPCSMPLRASHVLIRGAPGGREQFCGWCATRTDSGLTVRCDPAGVPYPDNPADARCYVARFRTVALAGTVTIAGPRGPIRLDRMSDSEAVYAAGQCRLIARNVGRIARQRAAATPYVRRLGLS